MKKVIALLLGIVMLVSMAACGKKAESADTSSQKAEIANPMVETDNKGIMDKLGLEFTLPKGAKDAKFYIINNELAECNFTMDGIEFCARMKATGSSEDISGMYYKWEYEDDCQVNGREGKVYRTKDNGKTIDLILWFDAVPGIMYSLSAKANDLDGFDIQAVAEEMFVPLQDEAG